MDCEKTSDKPIRRLPEWLKRPLPQGADYTKINSLLSELHLHTVCRSAKCPNLGECWSAGTATFLIMGGSCTRQCAFCAVEKKPPVPLESDEPQRVARASAEMNLHHVVITSVTRDDLPDEGAAHFTETIREVRKAVPQSTIEVLTPDFHARAECLNTVCHAKPDIFNHNLETVRSISRQIRPQADYDRSLNVLRYVKKNHEGILVKSGIMVGLGETDEEIHQAIRDLSEAGCQLITVGQYLAPSSNHHPVQRFLPPQWFDELSEWAKTNFHFLAFAAAPFVRSSYFAHRLIPKREP